MSRDKGTTGQARNLAKGRDGPGQPNILVVPISRMYQNILILKYLYLYSLAWWMDGLVQIIMGLVGLAGNSMAVPILLSKKLNR